MFLPLHFHVETADIGEWEDDNPLNYSGCDLAECEKYFGAKPYVKSDGPIPKAGERYRHFKTGKIVEVICVSQDTEHVGIFSVVYICKDSYNNGKIWHRPLDMFLSKTDKEKYPWARQEWRFEKVEQIFL